MTDFETFINITFVDFFGRVKDKAGDVERILKEKDRHGTVSRCRRVALCIFILVSTYCLCVDL